MKFMRTQFFIVFEMPSNSTIISSFIFIITSNSTILPSACLCLLKILYFDSTMSLIYVLSSLTSCPLLSCLHILTFNSKSPILECHFVNEWMWVNEYEHKEYSLAYFIHIIKIFFDNMVKIFFDKFEYYTMSWKYSNIPYQFQVFCHINPSANI